MPFRSARARGLVWLPVLALLATACVGQDDPGIGVSSEQADVVFGVEKAEDEGSVGEATPAGVQADTGVSQASFAAPEGRMLDDKPFLANLRQLSTSTAPRECPEAALNEFPDETAPLNADEPPEEGVHRWKMSGTQTIVVPGTTQGIESPIDGFRDRFVQNVERVDDTTWTFQTVEREFRQESRGDVIVSTFQVRTDAVSDQRNALGFEARTGEPDRGVALTAIERYDPETGNLTGTFNPSPPILYLPLPVVSGEEYTSAGVDPRTRQSMQHQAKVVERERVDACGEIVEGWLVQSTQTFSGSTNPQRPYNYIVAPHLGGLIISEYTEGVSPIGSYEITHSLAELEPRPLPQEET